MYYIYVTFSLYMIVIFHHVSADLSSSLPALLKVVKLVYSERKQLEKILKSTSIRQQDRVSHLIYTTKLFNVARWKTDRMGLALLAVF